ncbi:hypothetical protein TVAG_181660 [Trichomonas vaginalis G3]|uniref:Uncharacterized protein n=1 Tax=Trichomonas vaginalis (strain ATCC PRA-98 / G3) TaxID=412133 RepID=A2GCE9_TRIV3|nr:hypothetical protein TVAGG3_0773150 [Trichomonas vaginalis G3]EAX85170.1 hypothetical protein TVAG_181660 [Trichomonas vaginalis G3]KAI5513967.1 hypothetical protein TVAGG3_0773150 [Trichomonas vaginalis G3]|eukprot:XP_001298100.1 hypothetical protein [Trichomonas vaginalis G3]
MNRIEEAMEICFYSEDDALASKAFLLFSKLDIGIINPTTFNYALLSKATNIFIKSPAPDKVISRLSSLILYSIRNFPNDCLETCGIIIQLLQYIYVGGCAEMFQSICDFNSPCTQIQSFLVEASLSECVNKSLQTASNKESICQLIRLIRMSSGNNVLAPSFKIPEICLSVITYIHEEDQYMQAQIWRCLTGLISETTYSTLSFVLEQAFDIVEQMQQKLNMSNIFTFDFVGKYIKFDTSVAPIYNDKRIFDFSIVLMEKYQDCTNLIVSICRLLKNALDIPELHPIVIRSIVPYMIFVTQTEKRNATIALSYSFLSDLVTKAQTQRVLKKELEAIPDFKVFCDKYLFPYNELLYAKYGGGFSRVNRRKSSSLFVD